MHRWLNLGVADVSTADETRRVRTVNAIAIIASVATVLTSTYYLAVVDQSRAPVAIGTAVLFVCGYVAASLVNDRAGVNAAMWLALATGSTEIVVITFIVGFEQGPAPFFLVIALAGILAARIDDSFSRWFFVGVSAIAYTVLAIVRPEGPPSAQDSGTAAFSSVRQFVLMLLFAAGVVRYQRVLAHRAEEALADAHARSENVLLNILPRSVADRLRSGETEIADRVDDVTVMFIDLVGSTRMSEQLSPPELVRVLNHVFTALDALADEHGVEKIKTIGDAYMVVGGLPEPRADHAAAIAGMALAARTQFADESVPGFGRLEMRIGIDSGPVVAGVIGRRKFSYDLWGRTVNTASRMQSTGSAGEIQVTRAVYDALGRDYVFEGPRMLPVKGLEHEVETYFLKGARHAPNPPTS